MSSTDTAAVEVAADLGRRLADTASEGVEWMGVQPDHVLARIVRDDERLVVEDHEKLAETPRECSGDAVLHTAAAFASYVDRLADQRTTLWADIQPRENTLPTITAVFNDHTGADEPGWRDHRAQLAVQWHEDWTAWIQASGRTMPKKDFAAFLMDHAHNIDVQTGEDGEPRTKLSDLMMAVTTLNVQKTVNYDSSVQVVGGAVSFTYEEKLGQNTSRGNTLKLPERIYLQLWPFAGAPDDEPAYEVEAVLGFDVDDRGGILLGWKILRVQQTVRLAWERVAATVADLITSDEVLMLQGAAPAKLR